MPSITSARHLMLAVAITVASTSGLALAGPGPLPPGAGNARQAAKSESQTAVGDDAQPSQDGVPDGAGQPEAGEGVQGTGGAAGDQSSTGNAGAFRIARWMRSIGGRISTGPKIDRRTRVSTPNITDMSQGWRVSVPTFAHARMSAPPRRAALLAKPEQAADSAQEQVVASAEATDTPD
ncbi:MAG: hypothetical protein Q9O74_08285 [Planctomycetota bacterium]|nr:hypothetical protein [Planctomycetota bacterium]